MEEPLKRLHASVSFELLLHNPGNNLRLGIRKLLTYLIFVLFRFEGLTLTCLLDSLVMLRLHNNKHSKTVRVITFSFFTREIELTSATSSSPACRMAFRQSSATKPIQLRLWASLSSIGNTQYSKRQFLGHLGRYLHMHMDHWSPWFLNIIPWPLFGQSGATCLNIKVIWFIIYSR